MSPDEVFEALKAHEFERVRSVASAGFREGISSEEIRRVWTEMEASLGAVRSVGSRVGRQHVRGASVLG